MSDLRELAVKMMDAIAVNNVVVDDERSRQVVDEAIKAVARRVKLLQVAKRKREDGGLGRG